MNSNLSREPLHKVACNTLGLISPFEHGLCHSCTGYPLDTCSRSSCCCSSFIPIFDSASTFSSLFGLRPIRYGQRRHFMAGHRRISLGWPLQQSRQYARIAGMGGKTSMFGSLIGLRPIRYGHIGQFVSRHRRTSLGCWPVQSRHFSCMASIGVSIVKSFIECPSFHKKPGARSIFFHQSSPPLG
jgi:hypothetical protein